MRRGIAGLEGVVLFRCAGNVIGDHGSTLSGIDPGMRPSGREGSTTIAGTGALDPEEVALLKAILTDSHFWIPVAVLALGVILLALLR
jgi:hypothetical protein